MRNLCNLNISRFTYLYSESRALPLTNTIRIALGDHDIIDPGFSVATTTQSDQLDDQRARSSDHFIGSIADDDDDDAAYTHQLVIGSD